jgi:hypothetical protein
VFWIKTRVMIWDWVLCGVLAKGLVLKGQYLVELRLGFGLCVP